MPHSDTPEKTACAPCAPKTYEDCNSTSGVPGRGTPGNDVKTALPVPDNVPKSKEPGGRPDNTHPDTTDNKFVSVVPKKEPGVQPNESRSPLKPPPPRAHEKNRQPPA